MRILVLSLVVVLILAEISLRLLERRKDRRIRESAPDWNSINSYTDLAVAAWEARWMDPDEFLAGPFSRFLELSSDPGEYPRARARIMEFCRGAVHAYRHSLEERGGDGAGFEARARAMAVERLKRPDGGDGDYMIEVFDGISNHNYRGKATSEPL